MKKLILASAVIGLMATMNVKASITFMTPSGSSGTDGPLDARATFTTGNGFITIVLENLQTDIHSSGQALSGILFDVSGISSGSLGTSFSGKTINILSSSSPYTVVEPSRCAADLTED